MFLMSDASGVPRIKRLAPSKGFYFKLEKLKFRFQHLLVYYIIGIMFKN